jgi:DNA-binding NarL/FixJ family response regulator
MTPREKQAWALMAQGMTNAEISRAMKVSEKTIKAHNTAIFKELKVRNRTQAVVAFYQQSVAPEDHPSAGAVEGELIA